MSRFEVLPVSLDSAGSRLAAAGARIAEVRAQVASTSGAGPATGDAEAAASFAAMLSTWDSDLHHSATFVSGLGRATACAGGLYETTDGSLFVFGGNGG